MHFNHLMESKRMKILCKKDGGKSCYWMPTGNIRATSGKNVNVSLYCKNCDCREEVFLTEEQFRTQESILRKEVGDV